MTTTADLDVEEAMKATGRLTKRAARAREHADAAIAERTELVAALVAAGVPLTKLAKAAGVGRSALQQRANR